MNIKAIVFDLDGTLLDTLEDLAAATNWALRKHEMPERSLDEVRQFVGNGVRRLKARMRRYSIRRSQTSRHTTWTIVRSAPASTMGYLRCCSR